MEDLNNQKVESMNLPYISVIITAYNRKQYLMDAIKSVLAQTIERSLYEIIVIKNFKDDEIDDFMTKNNIKNIIMDGRIGEFLYKGISESKGKIISFLDDDDYFDINKLETIIDIFNKNPDIVYCHNNQIWVNAKNEIIKKNKFFLSGKINFNEAIQNFLKTNDLFFNLSSICIKKEYYLKYLEILKNLITHPDDFMLFFALDGYSNIFITQSYLTYYRLHNSTSNIKLNELTLKNISSYRIKKISLLSLYVEATNYIIENLNNEILKTLIKFRLIKEKIYLNYFKKNWFNKEGIKLFIEFIKYIIINKKFFKKYSKNFIFHLFITNLYLSFFYFSTKTTISYRILSRLYIL